MATAQTLSERIGEWIAHLEHVLPAQAPLRDFVHHNTLHGYQHLPFAEALAAAEAVTGARGYWPEARFRAEFARGRIELADLVAALAEAGHGELGEILAPDVSRQALLIATLTAAEAPAGMAAQAWRDCEDDLVDEPLFARCRALTVDMPAAAASEDWSQLGAARWTALCGELGRSQTLRGLLEYLSGVDVLAAVRTVFIRHLAAHLDSGIAAWRNPACGQGFYAAWRASAGCDLQWEFDELPNLRDEIQHLPADPLALLAEELPRLQPEALWPGYLERLLLELPGWSGMFLRRERQPDSGDTVPVALVDLLAVRVLLERLLCEDLLRRLTGQPLALTELADWYTARPAEVYVRDAWRRRRLSEELAATVAAAVERTEQQPTTVDWPELAKRIAATPEIDDPAFRLHALVCRLGLDAVALEAWPPATAARLLEVAAGLTPRQRSEIWLLAYEGHYREQLFAALRANHQRCPPPERTTAQVVMCMDDREEGTRRHLEEIAPTVETYGAAGFFGVAMYWQGMDDEQATALCPVVVRPNVLVREQANADSAQQARHASRRERRWRWRERLHQATRGGALAGPLLASAAALPALAALLAGSLWPGWFGARLQRWREAYDGVLASELLLTATSPSQGGATPSAPQLGFSDSEQVDRVAAFLRTIGLTAGFAPIVLLLGHGSTSVNNPHRSAYDCGACSGRHGGPNARVFAAMANRPAVRAGLAARGIVVPDGTWFVGAFHNTCDDRIDWYDLAQLPAAFQPALDTLVGQLAAACRAHAAERCRRLASAPHRPSPWQALRHVAGRAHDLSQARPELGHATNAAAFIGRRQQTRGLFLDRRVFLISYDPTTDASGEIVESILLAAGPVGAGISLEYYFSTVDSERYGCGSKITHNLTGLFGVMAGCESDLRTGLPQQMTEIHEPMRLLIVVEQEPEVLTAIVDRQPALQELIGNAWVTVAAQSPRSGEIRRFVPGQGWRLWQGEAVLPQVRQSAEWFAGQDQALAPALLQPAAPAGEAT